MQKYQVLERAGSGNFSDVYKARDISTDEIVAIKEMKRSEDVEELAMRELRIVSVLRHPNIIELKQIVSFQGDIKVVFQYIEENLLELYQTSKVGINENQIKCILYQSAFALEYLHREKKIIHRDIKPENILIDRKKAIVKLIDFGLAKEEHMATTDYVATRWYRSPENLIGLRKSTTAIDIFALACVIVELFTLNPLFPGEDTIDQLHKVFEILGTPGEESWPAGYHQMKRKGLNIIPKPRISLKQMMPTASNNLVDLLQQMLILNPERRITARDIMLHPFFEKVERVIPSSVYKEARRYLEQSSEKKTKIPMMKSLSPNTTVSNVRYSPMRDMLAGNRNDLGKESLQGNKFNNQPSVVHKSIYNHGSSLQTPIMPLPNSSYVQAQPKYMLGYPQPSLNTSVNNSMIPKELARQTRFVSIPNAPVYKKSPLPIKRQDPQYLGIDPMKLQNIKRKIHMNEGIMSPKYNVRYFKESQHQSRSRRNLSVDAPNRNRLMIPQEHPMPMVMGPKMQSIIPSRVNFRGN